MESDVVSTAGLLPASVFNFWHLCSARSHRSQGFTARLDCVEGGSASQRESAVLQHAAR